ncbi:DUF2569 family protein [Paraburkholderia sp. D1E]|uniref:DUF2569 family protein n=1 Tax=Paraburkholderia sp. D1E TaxID=3461398 RepID=UPI0040455D09
MKTKTKLEPKGIGGWLLLPLSGLLLTLASLPSDLYGPLKKIIAECSASCDGCGGVALVPIGLILFSAFVMATFIVWLLSLSYRRSRRFPKWMKISLFACTVFGALIGLCEYMAMEHGLVPRKSPSVDLWTEPLTYALIWIPYFQWSRRVKNTFTQP